MSIFSGGTPDFPVSSPAKAMDSTEIIPFKANHPPNHWHEGPALPEALYGGCLGMALKLLFSFCIAIA